MQRIGNSNAIHSVRGFGQSRGCHSLVVFLIDGRKRREACRRAGVEPTTVELDGQDPATYILSANINRRHLIRSVQVGRTWLVHKADIENYINPTLVDDLAVARRSRRNAWKREGVSENEDMTVVIRDSVQVHSRQAT